MIFDTNNRKLTLYKQEQVSNVDNINKSKFGNIPFADYRMAVCIYGDGNDSDDAFEAEIVLVDFSVLASC